MSDINYEEALNQLALSDSTASTITTEYTTFTVTDRTINIPLNSPSIIKGDSNSRKIKFQFNRYFDGTDLTTKTIKVCYENALLKKGYETIGYDKLDISSTSFSFLWTVVGEVAAYNGNAKIKVEFYSNDSENGIYRWQTKESTITILSTFNVANNATTADYSYEIEFYNNNFENKFATLTDFSSYSEPITVNNKTLVVPSSLDRNILQQDTMSRVIPFIMPRYYDGIDLSDKLINVCFIRKDNKGDKSPVHNLTIEESTISFIWVVTGSATNVSGELKFKLEVFGYASNNKISYWQTNYETLNIVENLKVDEYVEEPEPSLIQSMQLSVATAVKEATEATSSTTEAINSAISAASSTTEVVNNAIVATQNAESVTSIASSTISDVETRFTRLTTQQQQSAEVIDARGDNASLKLRLDTDYKTMLRNRVNYFNMKENGADNTGTISCKDVFNAAIASGQIIYFPKGTYDIGGIIEVNSNVMILGDGDESIIKSHYIKFKEEVIVKNIKIISNTSYNNTTIAISVDSDNIVYFDNCSIFYETSTALDRHALYVNSADKLVISDCKFNSTVEFVSVNDFIIDKNYFDMQFLNVSKECIHAVKYNVKGIISNNFLINSNADFIDIFPSTRDTFIFGNSMINGKAQFMEVKIILADEGDPEGGSNLTGVIHNIVIKDNFFSGKMTDGGVWFVIKTFDRRATKVDNDLQYYGYNIEVENNIFDDTIYDDNADHLVNKLTIFIEVSGMKNLIIRDNKFKFSKYANCSGTSKSRVIWYDRRNYDNTETDKVSINHIIEANSVIADNEIYFLYVENPMKNIIIKENLLYTSNNFHFIYCVGTKVENFVVDSNMLYYGSTLDTTVYHIQFSNLSAGSNVIFNNQIMPKFMFTGSNLIDFINFNNCIFTQLAGFYNDTTYIKLIGCELLMDASLNNTKTISYFVLINLFVKKPGSTGAALTNTGTITNYVNKGGVFISSRSSAWSTSSIVPTKKDYDSYF